VPLRLAFVGRGASLVAPEPTFSSAPMMPTQEKAARNLRWQQRFRFCRLRANGSKPLMKDYSGIWDLAAGTFIAVSMASGIAFIVASAI
jgi:hypothetical protein